MAKLFLFISIVSIGFLSSCSTPQSEPDTSSGASTKSAMVKDSAKYNTEAAE